MPLGGIQRYLERVHQSHLGTGSIAEAIHRVAEKAQRVLEQVVRRIRASLVVHGDEIGWRQDEVSGHIWTFSTPTQRYFIRRGRNKEVVGEVLDQSFGGVLVSDFYAAYHHYLGLKQRCWVHLLRDIYYLKDLHPKNASVARWGRWRTAFTVRPGPSSIPVKGNGGGSNSGWSGSLLVCCRPYAQDSEEMQGKLCWRIAGFIRALSTNCLSL